MAKKKKQEQITPRVIRNRKELEQAIKQVGDLQREKNVISTEINQKIQDLQAEMSTKIEPIDLEIQKLSLGIKAFTDESRDTILPPGRKSVELPTGEIAYREKAARVATSSTQKLIDALLEEAGLTDYADKARQKFAKVLLRMKLELDKEACLARPKDAEKLGISIETGLERFYIKPSETSAEVEVAA